jgi:hypothetical protein
MGEIILVELYTSDLMENPMLIVPIMPLYSICAAYTQKRGG